MAADMIASGGPSGPVWILLLTIVSGVVTIIGQLISARKEAKDAKVEASKAAKNSLKTAENTANLSNGFADRMDRKLDSLSRGQSGIEAALRDHLEWHLRKEGNEK